MEQPAAEEADGHPEINVTAGHIEFRHVDFGYEPGHLVLKDISFDLASGSKLALVGESGQGKTTIANLLMRFYEVENGNILVDGADIAQVDRVSLRRNIGVVFQDPSLFSGTVRENVRYGRPDADEAAVAAAVRAANAAEFVAALPDGLDTQIGERGVKLSGGQKQRIAIARAILKDAPILVLDEATSSLDSKAEHEVQVALEQLMRGRTTLIIAHRLSTIASVDKIVGLRDGRVIEQGSPAELAHAGGIYAELLELQNPTKANIEKLKSFEIYVPQKDES
jgi:ATP-binding cassette subfamily B protein